MKNEIPQSLASFDDDGDIYEGMVVTISTLVVLVSTLVGIGVFIGYLMWG